MNTKYGITLQTIAFETHLLYHGFGDDNVLLTKLVGPYLRKSRTKRKFVTLFLAIKNDKGELLTEGVPPVHYYAN